MGARDFRDSSKIADVAKAYDECVRQALFEYGHDGYNGTISTTSGYKVFSATPVTPQEAEAIIERELENLNKWDACGAIAISDAGEGPKRKVTRKVTLDHERSGYELHRWLDTAEGRAKFKLELKPGERIASVKVTADERTYAHKKVRNYGTVKRVFEIGSTGRRFDSYEEAEQAVIAELEAAVAREAAYRAKYPDTQFSSMRSISGERQIREIVLRGDEDWRTKIVTTVKRKVTVEIELVGPASPSAKFDHWLFFGWAAT